MSYEFYIDGQTYDDVAVSGAPDDLDFWTAEAKASGSPVLELGCGTGRVLIPLARAGLDVTGLDLTKEMLDQLREKLRGEPAEVRKRVMLVRGSMADFNLKKKFALVVCTFRAFQHLLTIDDQKSCLKCVRSHLKPKGRFIFDIFDPNLALIAEHANNESPAIQRVQEHTSARTGNTVIVWAARTNDPAKQVLREQWFFEEFDKTGACVSKRMRVLTLRWTYSHEMQHLLELCGFKTLALYGDYRRAPHKYAGEQIWVATPAMKS